MTLANNHISVCICTFKRPDLLKRLLNALEHQYTEGLFSYSVVVTDNDSAQSARQVAFAFAGKFSIPINYSVEPQQNIALARNKALSNAHGNFIALVDDDEYPASNWLYLLFKTCNDSGADGVLGSVLPYFDREPPLWITSGNFFERKVGVTGSRINIKNARTGNVLLRRIILDEVGEVFRPEFGMGGEDVDFFQRMVNKGCSFVWCREAVVYELVPLARCSRSYLLRRALLRGKNNIRLKQGRAPKLIKSFFAVILYTILLPFFFVAGQHFFIKYLIKLCDHAGRLLAVIGLNPVEEREMQ